MEARDFNRVRLHPLYIYLDIGFLVLYAILLLRQKKYMTVLVGLCAGILYMAVDYGIFHLLTHSRSITPGYSLFWVLLWMSMNYGFTNFTWIWMAMSKDRYLTEWSLDITIQRTTGAYHGYMAAVLFVGYLLAVIWNFHHADKKERFPLLRLWLIGVSIQAAWEFFLLLGGIRSGMMASSVEKAGVLLINSLLETNLGMPYVYAIYVAVSSKYEESLHPRQLKVSFVERMAELNSAGHSMQP